MKIYRLFGGNVDLKFAKRICCLHFSAGLILRVSDAWFSNESIFQKAAHYNYIFVDRDLDGRYAIVRFGGKSLRSSRLRHSICLQTLCECRDYTANRTKFAWQYVFKNVLFMFAATGGAQNTGSPRCSPGKTI